MTIKIKEDLRNILNPHKNLFFNSTGLSNNIIFNQNVFDIPIPKPFINKKGNLNTNNCNIGIALALDAEWIEFCNFLKTLSKYGWLDIEDFKHENGFCNLYLYIKYVYKNNNIDINNYLKNISKYKEEVLNLDFNFCLENKVKIIEPTLISMQIKNCLDTTNKGQIYLSHDANYLREEYKNYFPEKAAEINNYPYPVLDIGQSVIERYIKDNGVDFEMNIIDSQEHKNLTLPYLNIYIYVYFGLGDIMFAFPNNENPSKNFWYDIHSNIKSKKIHFDKRYKSEFFDNNEKKFKRPSLYWIGSINGNKYKIRLIFKDIGATQGKIPFKTFLSNNNMPIVDKGALDDDKLYMLEALFEKPKIFNEYALGDLSGYDGLVIANNQYRDNSRRIGINEEYIVDIGLTMGGSTNKMQMNRELSKFKVGKKFFYESMCYSTSASFLNAYNPLDPSIKARINNEDRFYKRSLLANVDGGRCNSTNPLLTHIYYKDPKKQNSIFDLDIEGAYASSMGVMNKGYGEAVIYTFNKNEQMSIREILRILDKELINDMYFFKVNGKLKYKTDFITSCIEIEKHINTEDYFDGNETSFISKIDFEKAKKCILTKEVYNGTITSSIVDLIKNALIPKHRNDILDNLYVSTMILYPKSMEVKTIEELLYKRELHYSNKMSFSFKLLEKYRDKHSGNTCDLFIKEDFGLLYIDVLRALRNDYKFENEESSKGKETSIKDIINTSYGTNVSKHFRNSNVIFGNNITANVRCYMWYMEKGYNCPQSITDGGVIDFHRVRHPIYNGLDSTYFVDSYLYTDRELANNDKWNTRPLNYKEAILNKKTNKWLLDGIEYDVKPVINNEYYYNENNNTWIISGVEYDEHSVKKVVTDLAEEHLRKCFPKVELLNKDYRCFQKDEKGRIKKDKFGGVLYTTRKGMFGLEVKHIVNKYYCNSMSDYMMITHDGKLINKSRSQETKKNEKGFLLKEHTALIMNEDGTFRLCPHTYAKTAMKEMFFIERDKNIEAMNLIPPAFIPVILKTSDYNHKYNSTYIYTELKPGCTVYKLIVTHLFDISRFRCQTLIQYKALHDDNEKCKRITGLGLERHFVNQDGTFNLKKMYAEITKLINEGVTDFITALDPHRNIERDKPLPKKVLDYIVTVKHGRKLLRLITVGIKQYHKEHGSVEGKEVDISDLDFDEELNQYSHASEFENEDEIWN